MPCKVIDSKVHVLGLRLDEGLDHWVVLSKDHEANNNHNCDSTCLTHVNQHECTSENHECSKPLYDVLVHLFPGQAIIDLVLRVGNEHLSPRVKEWRVEFSALTEHLEAGKDDCESKENTR